MTLTRRGLIVTTFIGMGLAPGLALAQEPPIFSAHRGFLGRGEAFAIRGYDPVAYHLDNRPVEGSSEITADWMGAIWSFTSEANRDRFIADPGRYAPAYGGYCAWAAAQGYLAPIDPDAFTIHEGRLYLNASLDVRRRWERDIPGHIARADANWPEILSR
ncbi:MAG: YHS domain-containing (seleno)protein [Rubricella sp.]